MASKPVCRPGDLALVMVGPCSGMIITVVEEWEGGPIEGIDYEPEPGPGPWWVVEFPRPLRIAASDGALLGPVSKGCSNDRYLWPLRPGDLGLENETVSRQVLKPETLALFFRANS